MHAPLQKRTSQGDFVTRLHQDATTRNARIKKLEEEAREKELKERTAKETSAAGAKDVTKIVERLSQVRDGASAAASKEQTRTSGFHDTNLTLLWQLLSRKRVTLLTWAGNL